MTSQIPPAFYYTADWKNRKEYDGFFVKFFLVNPIQRIKTSHHAHSLNGYGSLFPLSVIPLPPMQALQIPYRSYPAVFQSPYGTAPPYPYPQRYGKALFDVRYDLVLPSPAKIQIKLLSSTVNFVFISLHLPLIIFIVFLCFMVFSLTGNKRLFLCKAGF